VIFILKIHILTTNRSMEIWNNFEIGQFSKKIILHIFGMKYLGTKRFYSFLATKKFVPANPFINVK